MAFPLDIRTDVMLDGAWTNISADVYVRDAKRINRGRRDQGSATDPSRLMLTLNNRSGRYSPRNANSDLFGKIGRNTQVRLSLPSDDGSYLQQEGVVADTVSTPDDGTLNFTGDLDIRADVAPDWYGTAHQLLIGKWVPTGQQRGFALGIYNGFLWFRHGDAGVGQDNGTWFHYRPVPDLPERAVIRATYQANNGAGGRTVRFYWAASWGGPWTQIGTPSVLAGTTAMYNAPVPLVIGPSDVAQSRFPLVGRAYRFEVRSGIDGTVRAAPDFTAMAPGTTSFADSAGHTWTVNGNAEIRDRTDRFVGEISTWPQKWTADESDVWEPLEANGILRRLGQGKKALGSTLRRRIPSGKPSAYWSFEDHQYATQAASPIVGVQPASVSGVEWAALNNLVSSAPLPRLLASGSLSAPVPSTMPSGEWQVEFVFNADDKAPPASGPHAPIVTVVSPNGTVRRWEIKLRAGACRAEGYDAGGTQVALINVGIGSDVFHGWVRLRFWAADNGNGTATARVAFQDVGGDAGGLSTTYTGSAGKVSYVTAAWGALTEGWGFGHLAVLPTSLSTLFDGSDDAYTGETAWERIKRLGQEEGVSVERIAGPLTPVRVGPQTVSKLVDLFEEAASADGGWLTESPRRAGLVFRDRSTAYTQDPALTLSYDAPGLKAELDPVDDDLAARNDVTVTREGGSSARAVQTTGPLSVDQIGTYDEEQTVSLADDTLPLPLAYWKLHMGTHDGARYPQLTVMLHKPGAETLIPAILRLREGDKIRLTDLPPWLAHEPVDLIVEGWEETLDLYRWEITFNCSPGGPWNTAQVENPLYWAKAETESSALAQAVTAGATSVPVNNGTGLPWVSANPVLNANPDFDTDLAGWAPSGSALSRVPVAPGAPFRNKWAMRVVPNGVAQFPNAGSAMVPAVAGLKYVVSGWIRSDVTRSIGLNANWFGTAGAYLTTTANDQALTAGVWTWFSATFTAPVGALSVNIAPTIADFPPASNAVDTTRLTIRRAGGSPRDFPVDLRVGGEVIRATAIEPRTLNANPEFIANTADWTGAGATISRNTVANRVHPDGIASLLIAPNGSSASGGASATVSAVGSVVPGRWYVASLWAFSAGGWSDLRPAVDWANAAGTFLSSALGVGFVVPANTWTFLTQRFQAPADASRATMRARHGGTPAVANTWYAWNIRLAPEGEQTLTVQRAINGVAKAQAAGEPVRLAYSAPVSL